ncbi:SDR family NAD(P)-dependent oxidoreductase, partial [Acinetobacter baumannii]
MTLVNKVVLVTGASRGIGAATVRAFLNHGVTKVYAGARNPAALPDFGDKRVVPLQLDITSQADVDAAVALAGDVDIV